MIEARAPRGSFVLRPGNRPVVLISAGVGATPVLSMLHVLAGEPSGRAVWWLHGARNRAEHAFDEEARDLLARLPHAHRLVGYSNPGPRDRHFDIAGRLTAAMLNDAGVPTDADFYLCGPGQFMDDIAAALTARGVAPTASAPRSSGRASRRRPASAARPRPRRIHQRARPAQAR